jgi:hypothetical protein
LARGEERSWKQTPEVRAKELWWTRCNRMITCKA